MIGFKPICRPLRFVTLLLGQRSYLVRTIICLVRRGRANENCFYDVHRHIDFFDHLATPLREVFLYVNFRIYFHKKQVVLRWYQNPTEPASTRKRKFNRSIISRHSNYKTFFAFHATPPF